MHFSQVSNTHTMDDSPPNKHLHLHYTSPASSWDEALPLGNGRLGCMVYGRPEKELLQLNEDSVWYGGPQDRTPESAEHLPRLRDLIRRGRHKEAEELVRIAFYSNPSSMRHYEPLGTLTLEFLDEVDGREDSEPTSNNGGGDAGKTTTQQDYRRWLDLETAIATTTYSRNNTTFHREVLASYPDNVIAIRISASQRCRFHIRLTRVSEVEWETQEYLDSLAIVENRIIMHATPGGTNPNRLAAVLGVRCDNTGPSPSSVRPFGGTLLVEGTACTIVIAAHTIFRAPYPAPAAMQDVTAALEKPWSELRSRHIDDYLALFGRTSLRLWPDNAAVATDRRLQEFRDPGLAALYHNYGKYLMISSSRDSHRALPATLQGIWNPSFAPAWGSKYTININLQMNYWPVIACDLISCAHPLVALVERMADRGRDTASRMYGCKGWCAHHNTDIWADTSPQDRWMPATLWPLGGVWLVNDCIGLLQHQYDRSLHERIAPLLGGCIEFLLDFLIPDATGRFLVTNPSLSPENTFVTALGEEGILCEGSTMDTSIIRLAFQNFLWSCDKLSPSHPLISAARTALSRLPPLSVNEAGLIQEWGPNDYAEKEPGHRHVSHLFALHPHNEISPAKSKDLSDAAKRVLDRRAAHGGGHTGWSRAWLLNMHARLLDGEGCGRHMDLLLGKSTLPNLLDSHPPFQIDGNFGGCAGVVECLVQSEVVRDGGDGVLIRVLPACPAEWSEGEVRGIRVQKGWRVGFRWMVGKGVDEVDVEGTEEGNEVATVLFPGGERVVVNGLGAQTVKRVDGSS